MSVHLNIQMSKIMHILIKVGERTYAMYANCRTLKPSLIFCFWLRREERQMPIIKWLLYQTDKSSHWRCSIKNAVHKNFAIFTIKHLCWSLFWDKAEIKLQATSSATLLKRETPTQMFFCEYCKISNNTCFGEHLCTAASENNNKKKISWKSHWSQ